MRGLLLGGLCLACVGALAPRTSAQVRPPQAPDDDNMHSFSIPETRVAKARLANALEHIAASRWSEAIDELERLIEDHRGEMLGAERALAGRSKLSTQPVYAGASQRARELLFKLPNEARTLYRARFAVQARAGLEEARVQRDRRALAEVARRWPITDEAELAWWTLGDLELEEGRSREAREAWSRALGVRLLRPELALDSAQSWTEIADKLEGTDPRAHAAAVRARVASALAADARSETARVEAESQGSLTPRLAGRTSGQGPGRGATAWTQPWRQGEILPSRLPRFDAFFLVRAGDLLFVNGPTRVSALNAWTGALAWDSEEPEGWSRLMRGEREKLFKGVDDEGELYAAAADARLVVGVQQLPFALADSFMYSQMEVITPIPEKRLFAYEAATGRKLWDHRPPPGWEGGTGSFEQRMNVAGPPVLVGDRLLAPFYRMEGRIDFHVACFDAPSGKLLWSRALISGQRELNMFGRPKHEFCAPPLVVEGDRVVALTQLGTVACLDLFSGDILWQTGYEQIPIQRNSGMDASPLQNVWRQALPVVSGRTVIATPFDSKDMIGIDLATGSMLWSLPNTFFLEKGAGRNGQELYFIGAGERSVFVMGSTIVALSSKGGLEREPPVSPQFQYTHDDLQKSQGALGRPTLAGERLIVPLLDQRVDVDLASGRPLAPVAWATGLAGGNLLVGRGELFTISRAGVEGYFEWEQMVTRARAEHERAPADARATELLCQLLATSADNALADGRSESARTSIEEARTTLEQFAQTAGSLPAALGAELHHVLRLEARVRRSLADGERARAALRRARDLAPTPEELRNTLLEELALVDAHDRAARTEILDELERRVPELTLECVAMRTGEPASDLAPAGKPASPFAWTPVSAGASPDDSEGQHLTLPVGLWVLCDRTLEAQRTHDVPAELAALERVLARYADADLVAGRAGALASARIGSLYPASSKRELEAYEQRADAAFTSARARSDRETLARIPELYPYSHASASANDARVELALQGGQPGELLAILAGELHGEWSLAQADERELELLTRSALAFESAGNSELGGELLRTLAESRPSFQPKSPAARGLDLATLAAGRARWTPPETAPLTGTFQPDAPKLWSLAGNFQILGRSVPDDPKAERLLLLAAAETGATAWNLRAWSASNLEQPLWSADASAKTELARLDPGTWRARCGFARGRVLLANRAGVNAWDERSGAPAWTWTLESAELECSALTVASGIVLVALRTADRTAELGDLLQALDARNGAPLWRIRPPGAGARALPLCSSHAMVFVPAAGAKQVVVHDLFSGARERVFELDQAAPRSVEEDAWIEGDRLIVPWIDNRNWSQIEAWDVSTGKRAWHVGFDEPAGEKRELSGIVQCGARTWLHVRPVGPESEKRNPQLYELSTGIGALAPLANVRLANGDRILGGRNEKRRRLATTELFVLSNRPQNPQEARVRCIDLAGGERWAQSLRSSWTEITSALTPVPALSDACVVLAYTPVAGSNRVGASVGANVVFLDRTNGLVRADKRSLGVESFGQSSQLEFVPLGDGLLVRGEKRLEVWR